ncbi:hypothetical protein KP509_25G047400 [Ceratopteris richardii]|uniref:BTB domain-containing protein n=1 Tax=Ceratopteris richardii TaxID=49495 RepID=A0A8T2RQ12_CERRI|nr:hypothetical protein KP509_25G047400 [Ceratopteris richardii]KAH7298511.1 hypothetical protein KP509_25G047400 [Ceratopteris richardii]KAH7298512.1 hypothetical protein KP509_25G047400 [Ceratopteris richardii]KAH7298513.1 hypothetical protein KP509_25G047400 [Ceratopteris richardii]KAH7298514.1 hypothetical protein KP509_25G047400 [Ceratopteris richardii]
MEANSSVRRRAASPAASGGPAVHSPLRVVETVKSEASWCCMSRSSSLSNSAGSPLSRNVKLKELPKAPGVVTELDKKEQHVNGEYTTKRGSSDTSRNTAGSKLERKSRSGEVNRIGDAFKNGEIASLIKQGFIGGGSPLDRGNGSPFKIRLSPGRVSPLLDASSSPVSSTGPNSGKLNSLISTNLITQSSPPNDKAKSSPTLFEMMAHEHEKQEKPRFNSGPLLYGSHSRILAKQLSLQERLLSPNSPGSKFNDPFSSDVRLNLSTGSKDAPNVILHLHAQILTSNSRYYATRLAEWSSKKPQDVPFTIHISDCEDVEAYVETLRLMYCTNIRRKLMKERVSKVLGILKVSSMIVFEAGVLSCLEYLEAVPWAEDEEEKVTSLLRQLHLESIGAGDILKRLSIEDSSDSQDILVRFLHLVIKGTDEKARREMKGLVSRMLRENASRGRDSNDLSKENLYSACYECLDSLLQCFKQAVNPDHGNKQNEERAMLMAQIIRQADNLSWLLDILIDRQIADEFVKLWAYQEDLFSLHSQVPLSLGRYEVSRLTARLCVAVGQGEVMAPKEIRFQLLHNWLQPLIEDFGWMQRACRGLDSKVVEEGISQTILTLPLKQQQTIMVSWFDRFLKNGDDCPNLQRAFEIWWRRTFVRSQVDSCPSPATNLVHCTYAVDSSNEAASCHTDQ